MIRILFQRNSKSTLPEIQAYLDYFNNEKDFQAFDSGELKGEFKNSDFDVIWEFKGIGGKLAKNQVLIHEYASLSIGNFHSLKDNIKGKINITPDLRIFLNENVHNALKFRKRTDFCYRDMGINPIFNTKMTAINEYDFVYIGEVTKKRDIDLMLKKFVDQNSGTLCLIGKYDMDIYNSFKDCKNIIFTGKVPLNEVPKIASKARYAINYIPNKFPFNIQTSTKLLEYLALGLKVVTTDYQWVNEFERLHNCKFYKLTGSNDFDLKKIEQFNFVNNFNATNYYWDTIINKSKVANKIRNIYY